MNSETGRLGNGLESYLTYCYLANNTILEINMLEILPRYQVRIKI
jgi:hypothetical protein